MWNETVIVQVLVVWNNVGRDPSGAWPNIHVPVESVLPCIRKCRCCPSKKYSSRICFKVLMYCSSIIVSNEISTFIVEKTIFSVLSNTFIFKFYFAQICSVRPQQPEQSIHAVR